MNTITETQLSEASQLSSNSGTSSTIVMEQGITRKMQAIADSEGQIMDSRDSVEVAMRLMDQRNKTSFFQWVRNEEHLDIIAMNLKRIVRDYEPAIVSRGMHWLIEGWTMNGIASLLIKIYYERGLDNSMFAETVAELCAQQTMSQTTDLISTLIIGEDAQVAAKFIGMVSGLSSNANYSQPIREKLQLKHGKEFVVDLVDSVARKSQWSAEFLELFLGKLATITAESTELLPEGSHEKLMERQIRLQAVKRAFQRYHAERKQEQQLKVSKETTLTFSNGALQANTIDERSHREYCRRVMRDLILRDSSISTVNSVYEESPSLSSLRQTALERVRSSPHSFSSLLSSPLSISPSAADHMSSSLSSPKSPQRPQLFEQ